MPFYKNVAQKIFIYAQYYSDPDWLPKTGDSANITAKISLDGAAAASTDDVNPTEVDAGDNPGWYYFNLLAAETNADFVLLSPDSSTAGVVINPVAIYTSNVTTTRGGYLDNLSAGAVALASGVTVSSIANDAITAAAIATNAIDADAIADNAIDAGAIANDAITAAKINTGALTADAFAADALVAATFATDSITADAIAADAITEIQTGLALEATSLLIKAKTDNLPSGVAKGVALSAFEFVMVDTIDHITPMLGLAPAGTISQDGGAFAPLTNAVAEVGSGVYKVDLTAAEMNADVITLLFTAALADTRIITILTS